MIDGVVGQRTEGTPQGSPLSLLSNLVLDELDKELEHRGHKFVRYADDFNIYVRNQAAGDIGIGKHLSKQAKTDCQQRKVKFAKVSQTKF